MRWCGTVGHNLAAGARVRLARNSGEGGAWWGIVGNAGVAGSGWENGGTGRYMVAAPLQTRADARPRGPCRVWGGGNT